MTNRNNWLDWLDCRKYPMADPDCQFTPFEALKCHLSKSDADAEEWLFDALNMAYLNGEQNALDNLRAAVQDVVEHCAENMMTDATVKMASIFARHRDV